MLAKTVSHYRIVEQLGRGGMGVVYKAKDVRLGRTVALKFLSQELARDTVALERFRHEAQSASELNHPHICTVYDIGEYEGQPFIVMEFLEGAILSEYMIQHRFELTQLVEFAIQTADALDAAHSE